MRARIVIYNENINSILLIHRIKNKRDYWVIPGGGAQNSETPAQTAIREINEELQMKFKVNDISYIFDINEKEGQRIYFAKTDSIYTPDISGEEVLRSNNNNIYIPTWVNIDILDKINLQPKEALEKLENFLFRTNKIKLSKAILSVNGANNIGKTSFIKKLISKNPCVKFFDLKVSEKVNNSNWWFKTSKPIELCDELILAISKRNDSIQQSNFPIVILDKGIKTLRARLKATFEIRKISSEEIKNLLEYFDKMTYCLNNETSILFKRLNTSTKQEISYDKIYSKYDKIAKRQLDNNYDFDYILEFNTFPTKQTYSAFMDIIAQRLKERAISNLKFSSAKFIGISGLSESGKSSVASYLDTSMNYWNLKIINFINHAKLLVDKDYRSLVEIMAINLLIAFSLNHYFKSTFLIESVFSASFNGLLSEILGEKYKLLYLDTKKACRYKRSEDSLATITNKDKKKEKLKVDLLRNSSDLLIDNSQSLLNTKRSLNLALISTYRPSKVIDISNFSVPDNVKTLLQSFYNYVIEALPGLELFAYTGSTVNGSYIPGWSDIDVLLIVDSILIRSKEIKQIFNESKKQSIKIGISIVDQEELLNDRLEAKTVMNLYNIQREYFLPEFVSGDLKLPIYENLGQIIERQKYMRNFYLFQVKRTVYSNKSFETRRLVKKCFVILVIDALINGDICVTYNEILASVRKYNLPIAKILEEFIKKLPNITQKDATLLVDSLLKGRA